MAMSSDDLAWVRSWVGDQPDAETVGLAYDRLQSRAQVALEIWRVRWANFLASPASLGADGANQNTGKNIDAIPQIIGALEIEVAKEQAGGDASNGASFSSGYLTRADRGNGRRFPLVESAAYAALDCPPQPWL